jgi:pimeloyl-ACP methyl ester carboxylesterase
LPKAIFDLDGTLLDSVDLHAIASHEAMLKFGHDVSFEQARSQIGEGGDNPIKPARTAAQKEAGEAVLTLMRLGWGQENPAFRQLFTAQFIPGGSKEQLDWCINFFRRCSRNLSANGDTDVSSLLSQVRAPTLVRHARHNARVPFESGQRMAAGIPGARFAPLESQKHLILESEPAFARFLEELRSFLDADRL